MNGDGFGGLFCEVCAAEYRADNAIPTEQDSNGDAYASLISHWDYDREDQTCDSCGIECEIGDAA
jgi:hypothetical protein